MPDPLTLAVAQPLCMSYNVAANARAHAAIVRSARARLVVFPELSLTGYELDAPTIRVDDPRLDAIIEACAATGSLALAGAPVDGDGDQPHIGILAIDGAGATIAYRKIWLGGHEPEWFAPGSDPTVIDVDGWGIGLAICKDTSAPEHAAATAALGIEAYVAGVLESAQDAAVPAERARRIAAEHGVWVAMASFAGSTGGGYERTAGGSGIWGPDGTAVAEAGPGVGEIALATLAP